MDNKVNTFLTGEWWISVVIVGLLINIAAAYLKPTIDSWIALRSKNKMAKIEELEREEKKIIDHITNNPTDAIEIRVERSRSLLKLILYMVGALLTHDTAFLI